MRLWYLVAARLRAVIHRRRVEDDLAEELRLHVEREIERRVASGMSPEDARRHSLVAFGGVEQVKEDCRDARGVGLVDHLVRDSRHGLRRLVRDWPFTIAAVLILALGIGVNAAMFTLVNTALFRSQSFDEDRLVDVYQNVGDNGAIGASSYPAYLDMAAHTEVFAATTTVLINGVAFQDGGGVRTGFVEYTTASYPSVVGLRPSLGRWFDPAEDTPGAPLVAVVGYQPWITRFQSDPSLVGRTIRLNGVPATIIGIGPRGHNNTLNAGIVTDFWLPISSIPTLGASPDALRRRPNEAGFLVKARLRDGVTVAQAKAAMDNLGRRLAQEYPKEDPGRGITVLDARSVRIHPAIDGALAPAATVVLALVGLVLAIACSNLATLLLVRGASRAKEVSVRLALGATRRQLVRHLLTESVMLSAAGGVAGCILAWWAVGAVTTLNVLPIGIDLSPDYRVLVFAAALSFVTGVTFGLAPALKATGIDLLPTLRDEGGGLSIQNRWFSLKNVLVVFQVAVSVVLLAGASVFIQMLVAARAQRVGYAVDGVAMIETDARFSGYSTAEAGRVYEELRSRIEAIPGVQSAVLTRGLPMQATGTGIVVEGRDANPRAPLRAVRIWAGSGFFETLRIPVLYGRVFDERDRVDTPGVAIVNESMARQYFGVVNAVGRRFRLDRDGAEWMEVVGVVRDTGTADLGGELVDPTPYLFYRSFAQSDQPPSAVLARTSLDAAGLVGAMQRELRAVDVTLPVLAAQTMRESLERSLVAGRVFAAFLGALGALGLCLAGIGLYAIIAFAVSRRSREIGIRMALGARSQQVVWAVAREVAAVVGVGTVTGLMLSLLMILVIRQVAAPAPGVATITLYRPSVDPLALCSIAVVIATVAMIAAFVPARRAAKADPLVALRHQ
jgi:predicted permease